MIGNPTKVQRLIRLNAFREEQADDALRLAVARQAKAREQHEAASDAIDRLGEWKTRSEANAALDLPAYGAALQLEQAAMVRADALQAELAEHESSTRQAKDVLTKAACATRVSAKRGKRENLLDASERERRTFDQISDVWLNNRELRRD